jgi:hypothetical protein
LKTSFSKKTFSNVEAAFELKLTFSDLTGSSESGSNPHQKINEVPTFRNNEIYKNKDLTGYLGTSFILEASFI